MAEPGNGATLRTYLVVLRRRKWWVIALAVLGLAASLALSVQQAKQYSATAQLLVQSSGQGVSLGSAPQAVTTTDVQTDLQLATSAPVVAARPRQAGQRSRPISASEVAQTNVIALTAISATPARAALIANTYARAFVEQTQTAAIRNLTTASTTLHQQINALGKQISVTAEAGRHRHPGRRAGQPAGRAQGRGRPAPGQRGHRHERGRVRHPGPRPRLTQLAEAGPGRPAGAGRRPDAGPGRRFPEGQP